MQKLNFASNVLNSTPVSAAAPYASEVLDTINIEKLSVQGIVTGTASGTLVLQVSNDPFYNIPNFVPSNWTTIFSQSLTPTTGPVILATSLLLYRWAQVVYINASGSGTVTANITMYWPN